MNPYISKYKRDFAKFMHDKSASALSETEKKYIYKLFKRIDPVYHEDLSYYPLWLSKNYDEVVTMRDWRRMQTQNSPPYFLFSVPRIQKYLTDLTLPD